MSRSVGKKYRPVLSPSSIAHIIALAKKESPISSESIEVIGILAPFLAKIENDSVAAAYTASPRDAKLSIEESLGMDITIPTGSPKQYSVAGEYYPTKEAYWKACYEHYIEAPVECSLQDITAAREHMYLEGLMTEEELEQFERETGIVASTK